MREKTKYKRKCDKRNSTDLSKSRKQTKSCGKRHDTCD